LKERVLLSKGGTKMLVKKKALAGIIIKNRR